MVCVVVIVSVVTMSMELLGDVCDALLLTLGLASLLCLAVSELTLHGFVEGSLLALLVQEYFSEEETNEENATAPQKTTQIIRRQTNQYPHNESIQCREIIFRI